MDLLMKKLTNSIIQIIIFSIIPFLWWLITSRKKMNFFEWIGLKKVNNIKENKLFAWIFSVLVLFLIISVFILYSLKNVNVASSEFTGLGIKSLPSILIYAIFNTSIPEEILFRGFLLKRIGNKFGFIVSNGIQSLLFGCIHGIMFFSAIGILKSMLIILFTGIIGWIMGYINEKKANGSILPSWFIHAVANIFSGIFYAFQLIE
ncbi:CPBP family intramembrane glutamic endopeptidase [Parvimonas micra]|uniref:CPBP family intramembrane glutamic endopeptidase n=1 Tax=Parvimonas micra TaxID=33033 RepID=UPI002003086D|nr:CPBP family intramembrane glutamic endopeptidase [Parvimonas micra]MCK6130323.1 CPBP family intramembrane metalloprotease [Parvimonas micra]MCK6135970.1 CPBP family intramembrane metalloprotease [Parvimonas micra]MCK6137441.1 CPBP family intramembrane metalloprotease [Parvimonas micra]MCK6153969.1 CPBP family intramembrane metalloprotease [Parvimonas micra]